MTDHGANRPDEELVAAHLAGDPTALAAMYDRFHATLYDTARAMLSDAHDAEDATHDVFLIASQKLDQLRDPSRLRPWLFAILRNEVYRRTDRRRRTRPTDFNAPTAVEMSAPEDPHAEAADIERAEAAAFVRAAAAGLSDRDQLVLELSARQGLGGADLADALGVSQQQSHVLVSRMRDRVRRSIGALTVARYGRRDCDALQRLLQGWNGEFGPRIRKRIAGHVEDCEICDETSRRLAAIPLVAVAPAFAAPRSLRDRVLATRAGTAGTVGVVGADQRFDAPDGFPRPLARRVSAAVVAGAAAALLLMAGGGWLVMASDGPQVASPVAPGANAAPATTSDAPLPATTVTATTVAPTTIAPSTVETSAVETSTSVVATTASTTSSTDPPPVVTPPPPTAPPAAPPPVVTPVALRPGELVLSSQRIDLGASAQEATLSLTNIGDLALDWALAGDPGVFGWSSSGGTIEAGASTQVQVSFDRTGQPEGSYGSEVTVGSSSIGTAPVTLAATVERAPIVSILAAPSAMFCQGPLDSLVLVQVSDESPISGVQLNWSGPGSGGTAAMAPVGAEWQGTVVADPVNGTWTWEAVATDERGNVGRAGGQWQVVRC